MNYFPSSHPGCSTILSAFQELALALVKAIDPATHASWLIISESGREKNYIENSGSSMFIYSPLKGYVKDGITAYSKAAKATYQYITKIKGNMERMN
jgi:rhamnogalacturonyl hydrolase YesR